MKENLSLKPLTAVLIDDELGALEVLTSLLERVGNVTVVAQEQNPNLGLRQIMVHKPDVVFLDVQMEVKSGITLLKEINQLSVDTRVIFVSGYDDYTFQAFKNGASDYLVKPVSFEELEKTVFRLSSFFARKDGESLAPSIVLGQEKDNEELLRVRLSKGKGYLNMDDILYLKASGSYTEIVVKGGQKEVCTRGLWLVGRELPSSFFKIHRSIVVNTKYVDSLSPESRICVINDSDTLHELSISKACIATLEALIKIK